MARVLRGLEDGATAAKVTKDSGKLRQVSLITCSQGKFSLLSRQNPPTRAELGRGQYRLEKEASPWHLLKPAGLPLLVPAQFSSVKRMKLGGSMMHTGFHTQHYQRKNKLLRRLT